MKQIAEQYKVSINGPNELGVCEISTSGQVGTALPALIQDIYSCVKALIRKDFELAESTVDNEEQKTSMA